MKERDRVKSNKISLGKEQIDELKRFCDDREPKGMVPTILKLYGYDEVIIHAQKIFEIRENYCGVVSQGDGKNYRVIYHYGSSNTNLDNVFLRKDLVSGRGGGIYEYTLVVVKREFLPQYKQDFKISEN